MNNDEIRVYLKIVGFTCTPDSISRLLGVTPSKTWEQGDEEHPGSSVLHDSNGWTLQSGLSSDASMADQVRDLFQQIGEKSIQLVITSLQAELSICCAVRSGDGSSKLYLPYALVRCISEINSALDVEIELLEDDQR